MDFNIITHRHKSYHNLPSIIHVKTTAKNKKEALVAIINASKEYCGTEEGRKIYEENDKKFTLFDALEIPSSLMTKYGFRLTLNKLDTIEHNEYILADEP